MNENTLDPKTLLEGGKHRLTLHASLVPTGGRDRIQPAGFPDIGHVIYDSPQSDGTVKKVCIVDSAASMANHLETVCHEGPFGTTLHPDLNGLPYVQCVTDDDNNGKDRLVVTTLSEGHRLASSLFTDARSEVAKAPVEIRNIKIKEKISKKRKRTKTSNLSFVGNSTLKTSAHVPIPCLRIGGTSSEQSSGSTQTRLSTAFCSPRWGSRYPVR